MALPCLGYRLEWGMNRAEVIYQLKSIEPELRAHGVAGLYLFGSYARDEAGSDSDLDVFVDKPRVDHSASTS